MSLLVAFAGRTRVSAFAGTYLTLVALAAPGEASAIDSKGMTAQGFPVTVAMGAEGRIERIEILWQARCPFVGEPIPQARDVRRSVQARGPS